MQSYGSAEFPRPGGLLLPAQGSFVPVVSGSVTGAWNPSDKSAGISLANSNRNAFSTDDGNWEAVRGATGKSAGKLYFEIVHTTAGNHDNPHVGIADLTHATLVAGDYLGSYANGLGVRKDQAFNNGFTDVSYGGLAGNAFGAGWGTAGAVAGFALDFTARLIWVALNNTYEAGGDPGAGTAAYMSWSSALTIYPAASIFFDSGGGPTADVITLCTNASNQTYSPPSGFSAWDGA